MSPDGQFLAYIIDGLSGGRDRLMVQDLRGGEPIQVLEEHELFSPFWSPDGSELMLSLLRQGSINFVPRLGGPARVLNLNVIPRSWSPDDSRFVALSRDQKSIRVVEKSTGTYSEIAPAESSAFVMDVDWSPVGDLLVFVTLDAQERFALWTTTIDGSRREKIVEDDLPISMARWSANADHVSRLHQ
jgi:Tol biopolymer transport system component